MSLKTIFLFISLLILNPIISQNIDFPRRVNIDKLDTNKTSSLSIYKAIKSINSDSSIAYFNQYINSSKDTSEYMLYALLHSANHLIHIQQYTNSKAKIQRCLDIALRHESEYFIYQSYLLFAQIEFVQNRKDLSIEWHDKAIKSTTDEYLVNFAKLSLSNLYFANSDTLIGIALNDEIYNYYIKSDKKINPNLACQMLINKSLNDTLGRSLEYIQEADKLLKNLPFSTLKIKVSKEYARFLLKNKEPKEALKLFNELIEICAANKNYQELHLLYLSLANYFYSNNQYKKSQFYIDKIKQRKHQHNITKEILELSIKNYAGQHDYKQTYRINQQLSNLNDSIYKSKEELKYTEWAVRYKTEKKEQENKILKQENKIKKIELENNKIYFIVLILLILIALSFVIIFAKLFSLKKKSEELLAKNNKIIGEQNKKLNIANQTKSRFFTLIAHDLINPYNVIMGYSDLLQNHFEDFDEAKRKTIISKIHASVQGNFSFVKNLLKWAKANQKQINIDVESFYIQDLVKETIQPLNLFLDKKSINFINNTDHKMTITTDKQILKSVIFNVISNAIKFTPNGGRISIDCKTFDRHFEISIKDNGVGIPQENLDDIFELTTINSTPGTENKLGGGIGLLLCFELLKLIKGRLDINSKLNIGTEIKIKLNHGKK